MFSTLHTFKERNPSDAVNLDVPFEVRFWNASASRQVAARAGGMLEVEWPVAMVLAHKVE